MNELKEDLKQECTRLTNEYLDKKLRTFEATKVEYMILDWAYDNASIKQLTAWKKEYQTMLKKEEMNNV